MKKFILSLLLFGGLHGAAHAQGSDVSLGLKAGGSLARLVGKDVGSAKNTVGFHGGVFANIGLSSLIAFQPELLYSQKGVEPDVVNSSDYGLRLHYVDVPLAFHVNANGLFFEAGPQVGFLVAAKSRVNNASTDVKSLYNTVDAGYLVGLGYQRKAGLGLGLRYNGGITNVGKSYTVGNTKFQNRARNSVFQLYLSYSLNGQ